LKIAVIHRRARGIGENLTRASSALRNSSRLVGSAEISRIVALEKRDSITCWARGPNSLDIRTPKNQAPPHLPSSMSMNALPVPASW
jgi:hypothetical protein